MCWRRRQSLVATKSPAGNLQPLTAQGLRVNEHQGTCTKLEEEPHLRKTTQGQHFS